jgi:hypothetical protein
MTMATTMNCCNVGQFSTFDAVHPQWLKWYTELKPQNLRTAILNNTDNGTL